MSVRDNLMINSNTDEEAAKLEKLMNSAAKEKDVQEILEKIKRTSEESKPLKLFGGSDISADVGTVFEVAGKGELANVAMRGLMFVSNGNGTLKVEVDGKVVFWVKGHHEGSSTEVLEILFGCLSSANVVSDGSQGLWNVIGANDYCIVEFPFVNTGNDGYILEPYAEMQDCPAKVTNYGVSAFCLMTKPIKFNESVKITYDITGMRDDTIIVGAYTLDED